MSDEKVCCAACGSLNVQYAVWYSPRTGATHDVFGSWNAGDNTFCEDCDIAGRDPNPNLIDESCDPEQYAAARERASLAITSHRCPHCGGLYTLTMSCTGPRTANPEENTCAAMAAQRRLVADASAAEDREDVP